ncbi:MAG: efflux RND transporter permease subunit, partial [Planctomycetota bacterium]
WRSWAKLLDQRLSLLLNSGKWGLIPIFAILMLFLRARLAFWVAVGIPTCFLGAIWLLPSLDTTINMMSLFAFIVVLGIMIDDAIVVSENIHFHSRHGLRGRAAAKQGTQEMLVPVTLAVLTTIAAFVPMLTLPGTMGQFASVIPVVVVCTLAFSLIESLLILPKHLSHLVPRHERKRPWGPFRLWLAFTGIFSGGLERFVQYIYRPVLGLAMRWRYVTFSLGIAVVLLAAGLFGGGVVQFSFFPPIAGDQLAVSITMPEGTSFETTEAAVRRIEACIEKVDKEYEAQGAAVVKYTSVSAGVQPRAAENNWERGSGAPSGANLGEVFVELYDPDERGGVAAEDIMRRVRETVGTIPGARDLTYEVTVRGVGAPIAIQLQGRSLTELRSAADKVKARLQQFNGTFDIADDLIEGKQEFRLFITPEAEALGLTQADLARQVRQGFYGDEAQRIQRGRDDVKVMVRYPKSKRRSLADLENMRIRTPGGGEMPFSSVARAEPGRSPAIIHRADGSRSVTVRSDVDLAVANANQIVAELRRDFLPRLTAEYPGLNISFEGEQREQTETLGGLFKGSILALMLIYTLLSLAFGSFIQPIIVLFAIPFGMVGAVLGHWALGMDLTLLSSIGLLAMAGVVVNDAMILIDFVNRSRAKGQSVWEAVKESGPRRFRAVLLTSLTTFAGLTPLLLETSVQAQFLIPMAISLAFGVMFSTLVTLLIVPATYLILEDGLNIARKLGWSPSNGEPLTAEI